MTFRNNQNKKIIEVYNQLGKKYLKEIKPYVPTELKEFIKLLPPKALVLDVGCAGGRDSKEFTKRNYKVIGIDLIDDFLKQAKKDVPKAEFVKMDLLDLKFPQNHFDAIWANAVLLHINKKEFKQALNGFYQVLKKGGKLHIRVKKGKGKSSVKEELSQGKLRTFSYYSSKEIGNYLKKIGYKIIKTKIYPDDLGRKDVKWVGIWAEK